MAAAERAAALPSLLLLLLSLSSTPIRHDAAPRKPLFSGSNPSEPDLNIIRPYRKLRARGISPHVHRNDRGLASSTSLIFTACGATLLPELCRSSLLSDPTARSAASLHAVADAAVGVARSQILNCVSVSDALLATSRNINLTRAATDCSYLLRRTASLHEKSTGQTENAWQVADAQAWLSAALTFENDCRSALSYANISAAVGAAMGQVSVAINLTSIALSMIGAIRGGDVWEPPTRLSLYHAVPPPPPSPPSSDWWHRATATVAQDGSGNYSTVQAAVDAAPEGIAAGAEWHTIRIKEGVYKETVRVPWTKTKLAMVGDGMGKTVITGHLNAQMPGMTTYDSATVAVDGDGFVAVGMTFENTAGGAKHQAVALRVDSDGAAFYNCSVLGYQDTLYAHSLRQFYRGCRIEGTVDFIFGNAAAVFQECEVNFRKGLKGVSSSVATAQGRTDPGQTTAMVLHRCSLASSVKHNKQRLYLGRPWKLFSRTVFLSCVLPDSLQPDGWLPWRGDFALSTLFYAEYNSSSSSSSSTRVPWSEPNFPLATAALFGPVPFIQADRWLPATNVPFDLAL